MKALRLLLLAVFLLSGSLWAQNTGSISGVVTDSSGAVVSGAQVTITNQGTNLDRVVTTNASGFYSVSNLVPGIYSVTVEKSGFKPVKYSNTALTVAQALSLDASLAVGAQEQTIEVNGAQVAPIETESAQLSTLVDSQTLLNLPLLTRNPYELVLLSPGAIQTNDTSAGFSVNGSRSRNNNFLLDGVDNNDASSPTTSTLSTAATRERSSTSSPAAAPTSFTAMLIGSDATTRWARATSSTAIQIRRTRTSAISLDIQSVVPSRRIGLSSSSTTNTSGIEPLLPQVPSFPPRLSIRDCLPLPMVKPSTSERPLRREI